MNEDFRVGLFLRVACASLMGVPMIQAFTVFRISVTFKKYAVLQGFFSIIDELEASHSFYMIPFVSRIIFNYFIN